MTALTPSILAFYLPELVQVLGVLSPYLRVFLFDYIVTGMMYSASSDCHSILSFRTTIIPSLIFISSLKHRLHLNFYQRILNFSNSPIAYLAFSIYSVTHIDRQADR